MIKNIDNNTYMRFLKSNQAQKNQVSLNEKGNHYGYYDNDQLLGVISFTDTKNTRRIKGFLVNRRVQKNGIGTKLLESVLVDDKEMTAFATINSYNLFEQFGFIKINENGNNISFMKKTSTIKKVDEITEHEIEQIKPYLVSLAETILMLDKSKQKQTVSYICDKLKELTK